MPIPKAIVKFRLLHSLVHNKSKLSKVINVARKFTADFIVIRYGNFHKFPLYHSHFRGSLKASSAVDAFFRSNVSHQTSVSKMETDVPHRHIYIYIFIYLFII